MATSSFIVRLQTTRPHHISFCITKCNHECSYEEHHSVQGFVQSIDKLISVVLYSVYSNTLKQTI